MDNDSPTWNPATSDDNAEGDLVWTGARAGDAVELLYLKETGRYCPYVVVDGHRVEGSTEPLDEAKRSAVEMYGVQRRYADRMKAVR